MKQIQYVITGRENDDLQALACALEKTGCKAHATGDIDLFVYNIAPVTCGKEDYAKLIKAYDETALGLLRAVAQALPQMAAGKKRLCFVTADASSVNLTKEGYDYQKIIMAACNMAIATLFNRLSPEGYTFRVFAAGSEPAADASYAADYFLQDRSMEEESHRHSDEKRLVMRGRYENEIPW